MSKSVFKNYKVALYFAFMLLTIIVVISISFPIYNKYGEQTEDSKIINGLELNDTISKTEILNYEEYPYTWIQSNNTIVEVYAYNLDNETVLTDEILEYNSKSGSFKVVGIAKGYIKFISYLDKTVSFSVPYETTYKSNQTYTWLYQYTNYLQDGILSKSEIDNIKSITLEDYNAFDFSDINYFASLEKVNIELRGGMILNCSNLNRKDISICVNINDYYSYVNSTIWEKYINQIFPKTQVDANHSILFIKNGGVINKDSGNDLETIEIADNSKVDFNELNTISREGYNFKGWWLCSSENGETVYLSQINDSYIFDSDTKICAKWKPIEYKVKFNFNNGIDETNTLYCEYGEEYSLLNIKPTYQNKTLLGWDYNINSTIPEFNVDDSINNLTSIDGKELVLNAIWINETSKVQFYSYNSAFEYVEYGDQIDVNYLEGNTFILSSILGKPSSLYGSYIGWAKSSNATSIDYEYGSILDVIDDNVYTTSNTDGVIRYYAIYLANSMDVSYNANGGKTTPLGKTAIIKTDSYTMSEPISKTGHTFMGWVDNSGCIWTSQSIYDKDPSFYENKYKNKVRIVNYSYGFIAENGIDTVSTTQVVLTAAWKTNGFYLVFDKNCGTSAATVYDTIYIYYDSYTNFKGTTSRTGYDYKLYSISLNNETYSSGAYSLDNDYSKRIYMNLLGNTEDNNFNNNLSVTARISWTAKKYIVSFDSRQNGSYIQPKTITYGEKYGELGVPTMPGWEDSDYIYSYVFKYWTLTDDVNGTIIKEDSIVSTPANHKLYAHYDEILDAKCLIEGTKVRMGDGLIKNIEDINIGDELLSWDFVNGKYISTPVIILEANDAKIVRVINLTFEDGTEIGIVISHGFYDVDLNCYVYINETNYSDYLGHHFVKIVETVDGLIYDSMELVDVKIENKVVRTYSLLTAFGISHYANDYLSIAADIDGLFNIFEVGEDMKYDEDKYNDDIKQYGLFDYSTLQDYISEDLFYALNGQYLNVSIGKGLTTIEKLIAKINKYEELF